MKVEIAHPAEPLFARRSVSAPAVLTLLKQCLLVSHQKHGGRSLLDLPSRHSSDFKSPFSSNGSISSEVLTEMSRAGWGRCQSSWIIRTVGGLG